MWYSARMQYEHFLDRLVYRARPAILFLFVIAGPVMLFSYGKLIIMAAQQWPWWATLITVIAHVLSFAAIGCLFDIQEERRKLRSTRQDEQPQHF